MKIGLLGYGTVGKALVKRLSKADYMGSGLVIHKILRRRGKATGALMVDDPQEILEDDDIDVVVELMGGIHPAYEYIRAALNAHKHVITANKALINKYGDELSSLARKKKCGLLLSAACGGGIPIQPTILENKPLGLSSISGILNGTTNYILDEMESKGVEYSSALSQAQKLGYAEADPSNDVDGIDSLYKIRLAMAVGVDTWVDIDTILMEGISHIQQADTQEILKLGYKTRLIAQGKKLEMGIEMTIEPCLVKVDSAYAHTLQNYNLAILQPHRGHPVYLSGQGAGGDPTASNVIRDLLYTKAGQREMLPRVIQHEQAHNASLIAKYFVRTEKDSEAFKENIETEWFVGEHRYLVLKKLHATTVHQRVHALREKEDIFFARFEEAV